MVYRGEDFDAGIRRLKEQYEIPLILLSMGKEGSRAYYKDLRVEVKPFCRRTRSRRQEQEIPLEPAAYTMC